MKAAASPSLGEAVAAFVAEADVPPLALSVAAEITQAVHAAALGAAQTREVEAVLGVAHALGTRGRVRVPGRAESLGAPWAAHAIGTAAARASSPLAAVVAAAGLALASTDPAAPAAAVAIGLELALRIEAALGAEQRGRGWAIAAVDGAIGAAATAARLRGLTSEAVAHAIGLAATQSGGLGAVLDPCGLAFRLGKAAFDGVEAALLAERGVTAPAGSLDGRRGLAALTAPDSDPSRIGERLGDDWMLARSLFL